MFVNFQGKWTKLSSKIIKCVRTQVFMRPDACSRELQEGLPKSTSGRDCSCVRTHIPVKSRRIQHFTYVRTHVPLRPDVMRSRDKKSENLSSRLSMMIRFCASGLASGRTSLCVRTHDILWPNFGIHLKSGQESHIYTSNAAYALSLSSLAFPFPFLVLRAFNSLDFDSCISIIVIYFRVL